MYKRHIMMVLIIALTACKTTTNKPKTDLDKLLQRPVRNLRAPKGNQTIIDSFVALQKDVENELNEELPLYLSARLITNSVKNKIVKEEDNVHEEIVIDGLMFDFPIIDILTYYKDAADLNLTIKDSYILVDEQKQKKVELDKLLQQAVFTPRPPQTELTYLMSLQQNIKAELNEDLPLFISTDFINKALKKNPQALKEPEVGASFVGRHKFLMPIADILRYYTDAHNLNLIVKNNYILINLLPATELESEEIDDLDYDDLNLDDSDFEEMSHDDVEDMPVYDN